MTDLTTQSELDQFRERWRAEVAQSRDPASRSTSSRPEVRSKRPARQQTQQHIAPQDTTSQAVVHDHYSDEMEPKSYHDLPDKEEHLKLANAGQNHDRDLFREPETALEHYERAVEREAQGQLGESLKHYRQAFKLDDRVDQVYKKKHFPHKTKPLTSTDTQAPGASSKKGKVALPSTIQSMLTEFAGLSIEPPPPLTDASPLQRSRFAELPEEILVNILTTLALIDVANMSRISLVCKRLAYLVMTEESLWKKVALESPYGFGGMLYRYRCHMDGKLFAPVDLYTNPIIEEEYDEAKAYEETHDPVYQKLTLNLTSSLLNTTYSGSWRQLFRSRPRIRFDGCYISTVNYTRPGGTNTNTLVWGVPVHVVTYFRYLRFFRDGSVISLLTTAEPVDVVHHLIKDNLHEHHGNALPSAVMKDALKGRWRLTGPNSGLLDQSSDEPELEGDILIETEGATPKYTYSIRLALSHAGRAARNNKLAWKSFRYHNLMTDDWAAFALKNDKAYYWSRVKSFASRDQ